MTSLFTWNVTSEDAICVADATFEVTSTRFKKTFNDPFHKLFQKFKLRLIYSLLIILIR